MKSWTIPSRRLFCRLLLVACFAALRSVSVPAQSVFNAVATAHAQRNALGLVRSQVNWLQNSARTASNFGVQGYGSVWRSFQELRLAFAALTQTLTPQQKEYGANELAELNAGLDTIEGAFTNCQNDIAGGRPARVALANMCRVLRQGSTLWLQELNKTSSRLKIGRG